MRRNTPGAIKLGKKLCEIREAKHLTMREVGYRIGAHAATVSQIEKGQRALKEDKIAIWAIALEMSERVLRNLWKKCNAIDSEPITRNRRATVPKDRFDELANSLTMAERQRVAGYIEAMLEERRRM